jgi:hypothetical protein
VVRESLEVKGEAPARSRCCLRDRTGAGQDAAGQRAFRMRSIWFASGTSAYFGCSDYMTAKDWKGFSNAMTRPLSLQHAPKPEDDLHLEAERATAHHSHGHRHGSRGSVQRHGSAGRAGFGQVSSGKLVSARHPGEAERPSRGLEMERD